MIPQFYLITVLFTVTVLYANLLLDKYSFKPSTFKNSEWFFSLVASFVPYFNVICLAVYLISFLLTVFSGNNKIATWFNDTPFKRTTDTTATKGYDYDKRCF